MNSNTPADLILHNGRITTLDALRPEASALAIKDGKFLAVGANDEILRHRGPTTTVIEVLKKAVLNVPVHHASSDLCSCFRDGLGGASAVSSSGVSCCNGVFRKGLSVQQ